MKTIPRSRTAATATPCRTPVVTPTRLPGVRAALWRWSDRVGDALRAVRRAPRFGTT